MPENQQQKADKPKDLISEQELNKLGTPQKEAVENAKAKFFIPEPPIDEQDTKPDPQKPIPPAK